MVSGHCSPTCEKDTIEAETQQMADLLGFNSEMKIQENKQENIKEGKKQEKIPEILYQRKKYKGKKKKNRKNYLLCMIDNK